MQSSKTEVVDMYEPGSIMISSDDNVAVRVIECDEVLCRVMRGRQVTFPISLDSLLPVVDNVAALGATARYHKREIGATSANLCAALGFSRSWLYNVEHGRTKRPKQEYLEALSFVLTGDREYFSDILRQGEE